MSSKSFVVGSKVGTKMNRMITRSKKYSHKQITRIDVETAHKNELIVWAKLGI